MSPKPPDPESNNNKNNNNNGSNFYNNPFTCSLCNKSCNNITTYNNHINSKLHQRKAKNNHNSNNNNNNNNNINVNNRNLSIHNRSVANADLQTPPSNLATCVNQNNQDSHNVTINKHFQRRIPLTPIEKLTNRVKLYYTTHINRTVEILLSIFVHTKSDPITDPQILTPEFKLSNATLLLKQPTDFIRKSIDWARDYLISDDGFDQFTPEEQQQLLFETLVREGSKSNKPLSVVIAIAKVYSKDIEVAMEIIETPDLMINIIDFYGRYVFLNSLSTTCHFAALNKSELNRIAINKDGTGGVPIPRRYSDPSTSLFHFAHNVDNRNFLIHNGSVVEADFLKPSSKSTTRVNQNNHNQQNKKESSSEKKELQEIKNFLRQSGISL
ncbi:MAG: C2H2-type zinc finger protein [Nitrososphaeraceae archaeon]